MPEQKSIHCFVVALGLLRVPILVTALAMVILVFPPQTHEIFWALQESEGMEFIKQWVRLLLFVAFFSIVVLASSVLLLKTVSGHRRTAVDQYRDVLEALVLALSLAIPATVVLENVVVSGLVENYVLVGDNLKFSKYLSSPWLTIGILAIFLVVIFVLALRCEHARRKLIDNSYYVFGGLTSCSVWRGLFLVTLSFLLVDSIVFLAPNTFSNLFGPVGVLILFMTLLCIVVSFLGYIYDRHSFPIISGLIIAALIFSSIPINDNHKIPLLSQVAKVPPDVGASFTDWLAKRPDLDEFENRPYPVYIVSLEGGGLYAAAHAAWTLAKIQDNCQAFARHTFAISAVSGGSVGGALFAALVKAYPPPKSFNTKEECEIDPIRSGKMQEAVKTFFNGRDFLTPLLSAGLFPDFSQRFWPWPVYELDRALALEHVIETAWEQVVPKQPNIIANLFKRSSRGIWSANGDSPALLLNATLVHNGERVVVAPFMLGNTILGGFPDRYIDLLNGRYSVSLSSAVSASARFPLITPPASHKHETWDLSAQLVDGGYYENSGVYTVINLIDVLRRELADSTPQLSTLPVTSSERGTCAKNNTIKIAIPGARTVVTCLKIITVRGRLHSQKDFFGGDFLSAIPAMYQTRVARGTASIALSYRLYCGGKNCGLGRAAVNPHVYVKYLDVQKLKLPLGWYFSKRSLAAIFEKSTDDPNCRQKPTELTDNVDQLVEQENQCLFTRISRDLMRR